MKNEIERLVGLLKTKDRNARTYGLSLLAKDACPESLKPTSRPLLEYWESLSEGEHKTDIHSLLGLLPKLFIRRLVERDDAIAEIERVLNQWPRQWVAMSFSEIKGVLRGVGEKPSRFAERNSSWFRKSETMQKKWDVDLGHPNAKPYLKFK